MIFISILYWFLYSSITITFVISYSVPPTAPHIVCLLILAVYSCLSISCKYFWRVCQLSKENAWTPSLMDKLFLCWSMLRTIEAPLSLCHMNIGIREISFLDPTSACYWYLLFRVSHWPWAFPYRCQRHLCTVLVLQPQRDCNSWPLVCQTVSQFKHLPRGPWCKQSVEKCSKQTLISGCWAGADVSLSWWGPANDSVRGKLLCAGGGRGWALPGQHTQWSSKPRQKKSCFASFGLLNWLFHIIHLNKSRKHLGIETVDLTAIKCY